MRTIIQNGTIVNPLGKSGRLDLVIRDGKVEAIAPSVQSQMCIRDSHGDDV